MSLPDDTDCDDSECSHSQCWLFRRLAVAVADRERRRIRRAQAKALKQLRACATVVPLGGEWAGLRRTMLSHVDIIDAATRAKKGKRK